MITLLGESMPDPPELTAAVSVGISASIRGDEIGAEEKPLEDLLETTKKTRLSIDRVQTGETSATDDELDHHDDAEDEEEPEVINNSDNVKVEVKNRRQNEVRGRSVDEDLSERNFQDSVAAASALVGENILDSPTLPHRRVYGLAQWNEDDISENSGYGNDHLRSAIPSPPTSLSSSVGGLSSTSIGPPGVHTPNNQKTTTKQQRTTPKSSASPRAAAMAGDESMSVGIMAHGLAWVERQRDRRRRLYLQNQAEQQLEKLRQAQLAEKKERHHQQSGQDTTGDDLSHTLLDNPTFQTIARALRTFSISAADEAAAIERAESGDADDGDDDGLMVRNESFEVEQDSSGFAVVSQSGDGYTVNLPILSESSEHSEDEDAAWIPPVRIVGEGEAGCDDNNSNGESDYIGEGDDDTAITSTNTSPPFIMSPDVMQQIATHVLPRGIAYCPWKRLYSLARDGDSFDACLRLVANDRNTLLVVRTSRSAILGGFADMPWTMYNGVYYGGPTACLFAVKNDKVVTYKWSGANRYIQLVDSQNKMMAFGGGDDENSGGGAHFGLSVEQDFQVGSTGPCATFHNDPLCDQETFEIVDLEIYGFLLGQF